MPQGRTALHWAVFGASYHTKPNVLVAYEEIADSLIQRGVEINKQDVYQDTALDYLLYSPSFEMQTLLIENGASSGFLAAFYTFFNQMSTCVPPTHDAAVALPARPIWHRARPWRSGSTFPFTATDREPAIPSRRLSPTPVQKRRATGLQRRRPAGFARNQGQRHGAVCGQGSGQIFAASLVLDFSNIVHKNGQRYAALRARARRGQCP